MVDLHRCAARCLLALTLVLLLGLPSRSYAQSREDSNGIYQIITIGEFSPTDLARIRQLIAQARQQQAQQGQQRPPAQAQQPPGANPRPGQAPPGAQPPSPPPSPPPGPESDPGGIPPLSAVSGTGFLVRGQRTVVTNNHVSVAPPQSLGNETFRPAKTSWFAAYLRDGVAQLTPLRLVARQAERDLALFEAEVDLPGRTFPIADYDPSFDIEVEAIGYPAISNITTVDSDRRRVDTSLGFPVSLSMSQLHPIKTQGRVQRIVDAATQVDGALLRARTILHTATISPGNSGGPLVNKCGQVVGINTFTATSGGGQALFSVHTRELAEFMRAQSIQPVVATGYCLFPGTTSDYFPHIGALAAIALGLAAVILARSRPQIVYQTAQRVSRVFSKPVPAAAGHAPPPVAVPRADNRPRSPAGGGGSGSGGAGTKAWQNSTPTDFGNEPSVPSGAPTVVAQAPASREVELVSLQGRDPIRIKADRMTEGQSAIIGRDHSSDAVLEETSVSRRHAKLRLDAAGHLVVIDLGSANGTWRGDRNISTASFAPGEEVRFGTQRYRFEVKPPAKGGSGQPAWLITGQGEKGELVRVRLAPGSGQTNGTEWTIGRNENVVDIVVRASDVSSNHAVFRYKPGSGLEIADRNSSNGTWRKGERIGQNFVRLADRETIQLGEVELKIERA